MTPLGHRLSRAFRQIVAAGLCYTFWFSCAWGQSISIEPVKPDAPILWRPYLAPAVPPIRLTNSQRLQTLIRGGNLYLTVQDAIALVLENNLDIEVARYGPILAAWQLQRAEAGGALPGVPSGASQVGSVASGQGVAGSQQAAGVTSTGGSPMRIAASNATISQIGPVTQNLDPAFQESTVFSHTSVPQFNAKQSLTQVLISTTHAYTGSLQQGLLSGGSVSITYNDHYLKENAPSDILNPTVAPNLAISFQHNLLQGFGIAVNARNITVNKINLRNSDLNFKTQVISAVVQALNLYYGIVADYEDVKAKQSALELAQSLYRDNQKQVQLGSLAPLDLTTAESQVGATERDLLLSQTGLQQQEVQLKNLISRKGSADPILRNVRIVPLDKLVLPEKDDLPPLETMMQEALANRTDLAVEKANLEASEVSSLGTRNGILPSLQVFGGESQAGLAGVRRTITQNGHQVTADAYFDGGIGTALGQVFRRNYPTERLGVFTRVPINNRQAQADFGIDQLSLRQSQLSNQKDISQVQVDLLNAVVALQQARARYDAAVRNTTLQKQLLDAEQKKYALGASTPYNVTQVQRDLAAGLSSQIAALASWTSARISLDQILGTTLETNHISIDEARTGKVARTSTAPSDN